MPFGRGPLRLTDARTGRPYSNHFFSIQNWTWIFHPDGNQSTIGTAYNQWLERANKRANNRPNFVNILAKSAFNKLIINVCERANKRANKIGYYWLL
jgi:hypothetical protein